MKKLILLLCPLLFLFSFATIVGSNETNGDFEYATKNLSLEVVPESPCTVIVGNVENGNISVDITEGEVGDILTITVTPDILYDIESVSVNGVFLIHSEDDPVGVYKTTLSIGGNVVEAKFKISDEKLQEIAGIINSIQNGDWKNVFTIDNVFKLINWAITLFCSIGFFKTLIKYKKFKTRSLEEVTNEVNESVKAKTAEAISIFLKEFFEPFLNTMNDKIDGIQESSKVLTKCFILMQENTPESRIAILNELEKIKSDENALTNTIKNLISEEISKNEEKAKQTFEKIEELKQINNDKENEENEIEHL